MGLEPQGQTSILHPSQEGEQGKEISGGHIPRDPSPAVATKRSTGSTAFCMQLPVNFIS